jgi:predicted Zn-ribbon and HTH transcriptional regulator
MSNDIYIWFAENNGTERNGEQFIRAWTGDPERVESLRRAIGKEPMQYRAALAQPSDAAAPALYQYRTKPTWHGGKWSAWIDCAAEQAADYRKTPLLHDWAYEVRELFLHAQPSDAAADGLIYQRNVDKSLWVDISQKEFESAIRNKHEYGIRIVYAAPQAPSAPAVDALTTGAAVSEDAYVAKRMTETLAEVYATILGDDAPDQDVSINAIERVKKAAQVLRLEVDLYRANAEGAPPDSTDCEGCGYIGMSTVIGARCPRCGSATSPKAPAPSVEQPLTDEQRDTLNRLAMILEAGQAENGIDHARAQTYADALRALLQSAHAAGGQS